MWDRGILPDKLKSCGRRGAPSPRRYDILRSESTTSLSGGVFLFRILLFFSLTPIVSQAASPREIAEWVIRWEGRVLLEGARQPIHDVAQIPSGNFEIAGIDLTGAVMEPAELEKLAGLTTLRELYLPGPIWNPGGGREDANGVFKSLATLTSLEKLYFGWHFSALINVRDEGIQN